jgi:hypothetical protein
MGCHRQTVRTHLRERHGDILADEARKQVMIDELHAHFRELADFARIDLKWRLKASSSEKPGVTAPEIPMPGPISVAGTLGLPGPGSVEYVAYEWERMYALPSRDKHLIQALREHTKDSDLWIHWDAWRREMADYETLSQQLFQWVMDKTEAEQFQMIAAEDMERIERWLFGNILRKTSGDEYEKPEIRGRDLTSPGGREVIARAKDDITAKVLNDWLWNTLGEAETLTGWGALEAATKELKGKEKQNKLRDIVRKIDLALDGIQLMRAFPGHCHLCPV